MDTRDILLIGPRAAGKTSLLASLLTSTGAFLDARSTGDVALELALSPGDAGIVAETVAALGAGIHDGAFDPASVAPTAAPCTVTATLRRRRGLLGRLLGQGTGFAMRFHDYPGTLVADLPAMTASVMPLVAADAVIVPIDATLLMEASSPEEEVAAQALHEMARIEELVIEWVKGRARTESGLILLVPLKCESYFSRTEDWNRLGGLICRQYFSQVLDIVGVFGENITCVYAPVDTVGSCRVAGRHWVTGSAPGFVADYAVPDGAGLAPFGCEIPMLVLVEYFLRCCASARTPGGALKGISSRVAAEMAGEVERLRGICHEEGGYSRAVKLC